jgi:DNA-directed RNA polymerase subunit F
MLDIKKLREELEKYKHEPWMVPMMIEHNEDIRKADLDTLTGLLASREYGCSYNDVAGLIDYLEKYYKSLTPGPQ